MLIGFVVGAIFGGIMASLSNAYILKQAAQTALKMEEDKERRDPANF